MQRCLRFIIEGLGRLRANPLLRRNNYYTGDWEVRRALQTISLVTDPVERAEEIIHNTLAKLASLHSGMDKYFTKDMEVKKGCKKEVTAEVRGLAKQLQEGLVELNSIREQLLYATGNIWRPIGCFASLLICIKLNSRQGAQNHQHKQAIPTFL